MSVLKNLRHWFTLAEVAEYLSSAGHGKFVTSDVLRLCLDGLLTLSVRLLVGARARPGSTICTDEEAAWLMRHAAEITSIAPTARTANTGECVFLPPHRTTVMAEDIRLPVEDDEFEGVGLVIEMNVVPLVGVLDILLLSDARNIVEDMYQGATGGPTVVREFVKGIYLKGDDGTVYQLQEKFDAKVVDARFEARAEGLRREADDNNMNQLQAEEHIRHLDLDRKAYREMQKKTTTMQNYMPAGSFPNDAVFVVRAATFRDFESSVLSSVNEIAPPKAISAILPVLRQDDTPPTAEKPLPASSTSVPTASAVSIDAGAYTASTEDTTKFLAVGKTKRERQVTAIEAAVRALGYSALQIPTGGKIKIMAACRLSPELFGAGKEPFLDAWKVAVREGRVRMANHDRYSPKVG